MKITITSPIDGQVLETSLAMDTALELEHKVQLAHDAYLQLRRIPMGKRATWLMRAAEILEADARRLADLMTLEMGKTVVSAEAETLKCATACRYYAANGSHFLADEPIAGLAKCSFLKFQPLGAVLAIMPWNFPFWQVFRFAAPALMAGNTVLLKHAESVPQCAHAIASIFERAGFPEGSVQPLFIEVTRIPSLIADERIRAVSLTGSQAAGSAVASYAGRQIKKVALELGGSDPLILMPSADLDCAIPAAVASRMINAGQSCIAAKRILIAESIYDRCEQALIATVKTLRLGDPRDRNTDIGPLAAPHFATKLDDQVRRAVAAGARVLIGGNASALGTSYYEPTLLADVPRNADVYREEFFGPVGMLFRFRDVAEAIEIANDTPFGLSSSVWTRDKEEQQRFIDEIEAGQVFINAMSVSDARAPFGGVKLSGIGRELGREGIREFVNVKMVSSN